MKNWPASATAILAISMLSIAVGAWSSIADGQICWLVLGISPLIWAYVGWLGACLLSWHGAPAAKTDPIMAVLLGLFALSVLLFVGTVLLRLDIVASLSICVVLLALVVYRSRHTQPLLRLEFAPSTFAALVIALAFATLWSRQNLTGLVSNALTVTSTPWLDSFYHAIQISHFAHGSGNLIGTDPMIATAPLPPYHYAAYMVPSLLVRTTGLSSYLGAVAIFAPIGTLLTGLAAYSFGRVVIGPLGGLCAAVVCLAVPDPTFYLLENRWISYFFFQQISGTGAFGSGLMLMAWTFCIQGVGEQSRRFTILGLVAGICVVCFKSQIFLTYSFGLLLFAVATFPRLGLAWRILLGTVASMAFLGCVYKVLPAIPRAPTLLPGTTAGPANLHWTLSKVGGSCQNCIVDLSKDHAAFLLVAIPAFLTLTFGLMVPLCLLLVNARSIRKLMRPGNLWFLCTAWANYLVVTVGLELNAGHGDPYEIIHKTFVWPYLAISTWCGCGVAAWLLHRSALVRRLLLGVVLPLALLGLGSKVLACADRLQTAFVYPGSDAGSRVTLPREAVDAARFLRTKTHQHALYQTGVVDGDLMFQSLAERHVYVNPARVADIPRWTIPAKAKVASMLAAATESDFRLLARACHIDYFVLYPGQQPAWANTLRPAFQSGEYRVYRL